MHTHTARCGHALGTDEEYVKSAIKAGFKTLGFSDHAFFPNIVHEHMRGNYSELDGYISSINHLRNKYKKKIDIKLGFEIEYQENFYGFYRFLLQEKGFDFLILGQHLVYNNSGEPIYYYKNNDDLAGIKKYRDDLIKGMETGLFFYVCHPDLFMTNVSKITPEVLDICKDICEASKKYNIPLEINLGGLGYANLHSEIKGTNPYPNHYFWEIASKVGCSCVIGVDAHSPSDLEGNRIAFAYEFIAAHKLKLIEDVTMINKNYIDRIK